MGSHRRQPPLSLSPRFSPRLAAFVLLTHLLAAAAVLGLPDLWELLLIPVAASLAYQLQVHVLRLAPWSIRSILWDADGTWHVVLVSGHEVEARLSPSTFVSVPLVVINLRSSLLRRWSLPLFADTLDPEQLRRLRQRLRIEGTGSDRDAASA